MNIDNIINNTNYRINFKNFNEYMEEINHGISIINDLSDKNILKNFNIDINNQKYENLKFLITDLFRDLIKRENNNEFIKLNGKLNYTCFIERLYNILEKQNFKSKYPKNVCLLLMYYIAIPFIIQIESNNYNILINKYISQFKELEIARVMKNKMGNIYELIENYFTKNEEKVEDFINNVKNYITNKNNNDCKELLELKIEIDTLVFYLKKLIKEDKIEWLDEKDNKKISFDALLYFHQNLVN